MTQMVKTPPDSNRPGQPGAGSQNSENKTGQSPRSNPVCLEVGVTIRSLPGEVGGSGQPIREEARTVIVFDNGAVLRSTKNLPVGQKVILSSASGREVVCQVAGGRNMPSLKGYVEVEFVEPVNDFWNIHQNTDPAPAATPSAAQRVTQQGTPAQPPSPPATPPRAASPVAPPSMQASMPKGGAPTFEDVPGLASTAPSAPMRAAKSAPPKSAPEIVSQPAPQYTHSDSARPSPIANWEPPAPQPSAEAPAIPATKPSLPMQSSAAAPQRDFMSKGLMAYDKGSSGSGAAAGRAPMIVGIAALVLAGVSGVVYYTRRANAPAPVAQSRAVSQPPAPPAPTANTAPEPVPASQPDASAAAAQSQPQEQPVAAELTQASPAATSLPAVVTSPVAGDVRPEARNTRRQEKTPQAKAAEVVKQPEAPSPRRPAIPSLKMSSPSAPIQKASSAPDAGAPLTEIVSAETAPAPPSTNLLTSSGKVSGQPAPPPGAAIAAPAAAPPAPLPAPKVVTDPKLISSSRVEYPAAAKSSNVQGSVTLRLTIDTRGNVVEARALNGPMLLRQAAEESVRQWKYSPGLVDGKPTATQVTVSVDFRLK
jgi:protein TonB